MRLGLGHGLGLGVGLGEGLGLGVGLGEGLGVGLVHRLTAGHGHLGILAGEHPGLAQGLG